MAGARIALTALLISAAACSSAARPPLQTVAFVDLPRFMGDWYVIASIPTSVEKEAYDAVESYRLRPDGVVETTFTFRRGGFDGPPKRYTPKGYVLDRRTNAVWGMQFVWPIRAEYLITYLAEDYSATIIGRNKRDYVWIMARTPQIPEAGYARLLALVGEQGYDVSRVRRVPQRPREEPPPEAGP
ncbi:MAG TPA: lipocalin family protein [Thermoanaerobaculia bacterium]|nr:lipocalin family protein [Thermoanaerobaculia bacterium]